MKHAHYFLLLSFGLMIFALVISPTGISYAVGPYPVTADTYTDRNYINTNHGSDPSLMLSATKILSCVETTYLWFKFLVPNPEATISNAILTVPLAAGSGVMDLELRTIADADFGWNENTLVWNGQPALLPTVLATSPNPAPGTDAVFLGTELANFLNNHKNQEVTLVVRANCAGTVGPAAARSVYTKEHSSGSGVELELRGPTAIQLQRFSAITLSNNRLFILSLALITVWLVIYIYRKKAVG